MMIELPWPSSILSPNARPHWGARNRAFSKHKSWAHNATLAHRPALQREPLPEGELRVVVTAYPPTAHKMDRDNFLSRCKAYLDGISYCLGIDDCRFDPRVQWGEVCKPGKVVIVIGGMGI